MTLFNGWVLKKSNPDAERNHLNKILQDIDVQLDAAIAGGVNTVQAGQGVDVDATDSNNPIVSVEAAVISGAADGATAVQPGDNVSVLVNDAGYSTTTGTVESVTGTLGVTVNNTDPANPIVSHDDTSTVANLSSNNSSGVVLQDISFTFDTYGHVTACSVGTVDLDLRYDSLGAAAAAQAASQPLDATLTALAGANWALNSFPIGTGPDTLSQVAFAANTFPARASAGNLVAKAITDGALGVMAGTSGASNFMRGDGTASSTLAGSLTLQSGPDGATLGGVIIPGVTSGSATIGASSVGRLALENTQTATTLIDIDPKPGDGTSNGSFRFFRNTNTTGAVRFQIFIGTNTGTLNAEIYGKGGDTYFCANNGNVLIGTAAASGGAAKLQVNGICAPTTDNTHDLGEASFRWAVVRAGTGTINTSDARHKTDFRPFTDTELAAALELSEAVGFFRFIESVEKKGGQAREHCGLTVQRAIEIMQAHGLDPFGYGFICHDTWQASPEVWVEHPAIEEERNPETGDVTVQAEDAWKEKVQESRVAGDLYSFRPDQLDRFIAKGIRENQKRIEARLAALESRK